jgi:hypothetical protein
MLSAQVADSVDVRGESGGESAGERAVWVCPDFDEFATAPEVTAYAGGR